MLFGVSRARRTIKPTVSASDGHVEKFSSWQRLLRQIFSQVVVVLQRDHWTKATTTTRLVLVPQFILACRLLTIFSAHSLTAVSHTKALFSRFNFVLLRLYSSLILWVKYMAHFSFLILILFLCWFFLLYGKINCVFTSPLAACLYVLQICCSLFL